MANTTFALLRADNWPSNSATYSQRTVHTEEEIYPGHGAYYSTAGGVKKATINGGHSDDEFAGVIGLKYDHDPDTAYTSGETGIPLIEPDGAVEFPAIITDANADYRIGQILSVGATTAGVFDIETAGSGNIVARLSEDYTDNDTRGFLKFAGSA